MCAHGERKIYALKSNWNCKPIDSKCFQSCFDCSVTMVTNVHGFMDMICGRNNLNLFHVIVQLSCFHHFMGITIAKHSNITRSWYGVIAQCSVKPILPHPQPSPNPPLNVKNGATEKTPTETADHVTIKNKSGVSSVLFWSNQKLKWLVIRSYLEYREDDEKMLHWNRKDHGFKSGGSPDFFLLFLQLLNLCTAAKIYLSLIPN